MVRAIVLVIMLIIVYSSQNQVVTPGEIQLLYEFPRTQPYVTVGYLENGDEVALIRKNAKTRSIKNTIKEASKFGANAVVFEGFYKDGCYWSNGIHLDGVAIRVKNISSSKISIGGLIFKEPGSNDNTFATEELVCFDFKGQICLGEIIEITSNGSSCIIHFYNQRTGKIQRIKKSFGELYKYPIK